MKNNKNAENIVVVIIAVFILSFTLIGIVNIFSFHFDIHGLYREDLKKYLLNENIKTISQKIDLSKIAENEEFFIHKNTSNNTFETFTGSIGENYRYINTSTELSENTLQNLQNTYNHSIIKLPSAIHTNSQITDLSSIYIHLDAKNIDGSHNSTLSQDDTISDWSDISQNSTDMNQWSSSLQPIFQENIYGAYPMVYFDGINDRYTHTISHTGWSKKTIALVIRTWTDITSEQTLYDEWSSGGWYRFYIENNDIYFRFSDGADHDIKISNILPNTLYFIAGVHDASHGNVTLDSIQIYNNNVLVDDLLNMWPVTSYNDIWIGRWLTGWWEFEWYIWSILAWNQALNSYQLSMVYQYLRDSWDWNASWIEYNSVEITLTPLTLD